MMRKKNKRSVLPCQKHFKELTLPFEGRRMLIRTEDIHEFSAFNTTEVDIPADSLEPDLVCSVSTCRLSENKVNLYKEDQHCHGKDESLFPVDNQSHDCTRVFRDNSERHSSFAEFSDIVTARTSKAKTDECYRKTTPMMNYKLQKNDISKTHISTKGYYDDRADSLKIHSSTGQSDGNIHKHKDESKHGEERGYATNYEKRNLNKSKNPLRSHHDDDDDDKMRSRSKDVNRQQTPHDIELIEYSTSLSRNSSERGDTTESTKCMISNSEMLERTEEMKAHEDHTENRSTPEGKGTHTHHIRREKHYTGEDNSQYSYVIRINCQSPNDNSEEDVNNSGKTLTKRRRGDITGMRSYLEISSELNRASESKTSLVESSSNDEKSNTYKEVDHRTIDCQYNNETHNSLDVFSNNDTRKHNYSCKSSSSKTNAAGRLIDHLERKEYLQATVKNERSPSNIFPDIARNSCRRDEATLRILRDPQKRMKDSKRNDGSSVALVVPTQSDVAYQGFDKTLFETDRDSCSGDADSPKACKRSDEISQRIDGDSRNLIKTQCVEGNNQNRSYFLEHQIDITSRRTHLIDERANLELCQDISHRTKKENVVSIDSNIDCNISDSLKMEQDSEDSFNDLALANVNENKKHARGFYRSIMHNLHCTGSDNNERTQVNNGERSKAGVKLRQETDNDAYRDIDVNKEKCKTNNQYACCGSQTQNKFADESKLINYQFMRKNNENMSRGQCPENPQASVTIKRVLKPGVVHVTTRTPQSGQKSPSLCVSSKAEQLDNGDAQIDNVCAIQTDKHNSNNAFNKSPELNLKCTRSDGSPFLQRCCRKESRHPLSHSKIQKQPAFTSPIIRSDTDRRANDAFSYTLESPSQLQSPEMSTALQNENCSNGMGANRENDVHSHYACNCSSQRLQSPRPKSKSNVVDESGMSTLNELKVILDAARADSLTCSTRRDSNTSHVCCSDTVTECNSGCSFLGQYLRSLWKQQILCDTKVIVGQEEFLVHKLVMAAYSSVFCPPTTRPEPTVCFCIPNSSSEAVHEIFSYMYTSTMTLTDEILEDVINAANFMGVQEVIDIVKDILIHPTLDNMNLYNDIVRRLGLQISLLDQEEVYRESFSEMKNKVAFLNLNLQEIECILMDPEVMVTNEVETIEVIISWVEYNYLQRLPGLRTLLNHVSFECIPPSELVKLAEKYSHIFDTPAGNSFMCEAFRFHALKSADFKTSKQTDDDDDHNIDSPDYNNAEDVAPVCNTLPSLETKFAGVNTRDEYSVRDPDNIKECSCSKNSDHEKVNRVRKKNMPDKAQCSDNCDYTSRIPSYLSHRSADSNQIRNWVDDTETDPREFRKVSQRSSQNSVSPANLRATLKSSLWESKPQESLSGRGLSRRSFNRNSKSPAARTLAGDTPARNVEIHPSSAHFEKKMNKGRTSRVSFHESTAEGSPEHSTAMKYAPSKTKSNISRNNNAVDDAQMISLNSTNNHNSVHSIAQKTGSSESDINVSSNNLLYNNHVSLKLRELPTNYYHNTEVHNKLNHFNEIFNFGVSQTRCAVSRENPKSLITNENCKVDYSLNNSIVICKRELDFDDNLGQLYSEVPLERKMFMRKNCNSCCTENVDGKETQKINDQKYLSEDRNNTNKSQTCQVDNAVGKQLGINLDRGIKIMDKEVTEDSLILLGHDAEASAFRVYKSPADQLS